MIANQALARYRQTQSLIPTGTGVQQEARRRRNWAIGSMAIGWSLLLIAFLGRDGLSNRLKFGLLVGAIAGGAVAATTSSEDDTLQKLADQFNAAQRRELSHHLNLEHEFSGRVRAIADAQDTFALIAQLPVEQQVAWLTRLGYPDFIPVVAQPVYDLPQGLEALEVGRPQAVSVLPEGVIDTAWLTPEFARSSKVVVAERGGGKSNYLYWEVSQLDPADKNFICDPHLLANQSNRGGSVWIDCSPEEERKQIAHTSAAIARILTEVTAEGRARLAGKPWTQRIKVVLDEGDDRIVIGKEGCIGELMEFLEECSNAWRKVGIEVTLVLHTLKKGQTGLDMSILSQFSWLIMGGFGASRDVPWPHDFDATDWSKQREQANAGLPQDRARACILRLRGDGVAETRIVAMPKISASETSSTAEVSESADPAIPTIFDRLRSRCGDRATLGQVYSALYELQQTPPTEEALNLAIARSGIEIIAEGSENAPNS
jgi:hypothetical protein